MPPARKAAHLAANRGFKGMVEGRHYRLARVLPYYRGTSAQCPLGRDKAPSIKSSSRNKR